MKPSNEEKREEAMRKYLSITISAKKRKLQCLLCGRKPGRRGRGKPAMTSHVEMKKRRAEENYSTAVSHEEKLLKKAEADSIES